MDIDPKVIVSILDLCCGAFTFPMLDNGYKYLACTRMSLYRSSANWAMVIEVFGFSPRSGSPDTHIHTFASKLHNRDAPEQYVNRNAYENYLANNQHNDSRFVFPVDEGDWQDGDNQEWVAENASEVSVRGQAFKLPMIHDYERLGIKIENQPRIQVFELCRFLAATTRESVLGTTEERRVSVLPEMSQILQLEEWHHPDVVAGELPSNSETFQQLAHVLSTGNVELYRPSATPNTHWRNWPDGGRL
jgi:hypothetical protein